MSLSAGDEVTAEPIPANSIHDLYLGALDLEIGFLKANLQIAEQFSADDIAKNVIKAYTGQMFGMNQVATLDFHGQTLRAVVKGMQVLELSSVQRKGNKPTGSGVGTTMGILMDKTDVTIMKDPASHIKLKASSKKQVISAIRCYHLS
jgi:vesicle-fusing ATPase